MALIPSAINPVYLFKTDEPAYWDQNYYGPDRGNYFRKWPKLTDFRIYFQSDTAAVNGYVKDCDGVLIDTLLAPTLITDNYYYFNVPITSGYPEGKSFIITLSRNAAEFLIVTNTLGGGVGATVHNGSGASVVFSKSIVIQNITVSLFIAVAQTLPADIYWYKVNPADGNDKKLLAVTAQTFVGTGNMDVTLNFPLASVASYWSKGDRLTFVIFPRGVDVLTFNCATKGVTNVSQLETGIAEQAAGSAEIRVNTSLGTKISIAGYEALFSEQFRVVNYMKPSIKNQTLVSYSNKRLYQGIPANTEIRTFWPISFWQTNNPQQFEDIEILPGEFTRLRNELNNETMMETDYLPPYMHRSIQLSLAMDTVKINDVEQIQRSEYSYAFPNRHYALSKGKVTLTERKSIVRNVI